jgi:hypothetical protein
LSTRGRYEDITTILYMVPFLACAVYGLVLWAEQGISAILPSSVYLTVTRNPDIFILGSLAVMLGLMIELTGSDPSQRHAKLVTLGGTLQTIAVASLAFAIVGALYANALNLSGTASDIMVGRYDLVFPFVMFLMSYLITAQFKISAFGNRTFLAIVVMLLAIGSIYEIGKREVAVGLGIALLLLVIGILAYLLPQKKADSSVKE